MIVKAADSWASNADLIADIARLGYIDVNDRVLDPTYGRGIWWQKFRPAALVTHDIKLDGVDFRKLPHGDNSFNVVAYDPPYVSVGGRKTTTIPDFQNRYGMTDAPTSPASLQQLINDGLTEALRVVKPKGYILCKCQDYVSSGKLWIGTHWTLTYALSIGLTCVDRLEHIGRARAQPSGRSQQHARRNLSTMFILQKGVSR